MNMVLELKISGSPLRTTAKSSAESTEVSRGHSSREVKD